MEVWIIAAALWGGVLAIFFGSRWFASWNGQRELRQRDERRHAEQLEWRRRQQAGQPIPARYETVYRDGEMVDEDAARMAELGYYIADEVLFGDGSRRVVYRLEGVSAL